MTTLSIDTAPSLREAPRVLARRWTEHPELWVRGSMDDGQGHTCLHGGALLVCKPLPGDGPILRAVLRQWELDENWNDAPSRTAQQVAAAVDRDVTDADLAATFGPQWEEIVAFVRRAAVLTTAEALKLDARAAAWGAARAAAWGAAWDAARGAAAAQALVVRDLIGQDRFTQRDYDILTRPWAEAIGPVHPDDAPVSALTTTCAPALDTLTLAAALVRSTDPIQTATWRALAACPTPLLGILHATALTMPYNLAHALDAVHDASDRLAWHELHDGEHDQCCGWECDCAPVMSVRSGVDGTPERCETCLQAPHERLDVALLALRDLLARVVTDGVLTEAVAA